MSVVPNRILKESIRTSKQIAALDDFEFRLWTYLLTYVDDYGRGSADADLLKGFLFPRRKSVTEKSIQTALEKLNELELVQIYRVRGDVYLCFPRWGEHQRIRSKVSKFPAPDECDETLTNDSALPQVADKPKEDIPYGEIIDYLNEKCGTTYKATTKTTREHIRARYADGFKLDDFKKVIDNKSAEWLGDEKMQKFLRPETLFGTKFESYLNQQNGSSSPYSHSDSEWDDFFTTALNRSYENYNIKEN